MNSWIEETHGFQIGTVESVSPNEIRILLDIDAPQSMALNAINPRSFPRINSYVVVPNETGLVVCIVNWLGIEQSPYPKRKGFQDFGLVDMPFPLRKMTVVPLATLKSLFLNDHPDDQSIDPTYKIERSFQLDRGVFLFPSVGDRVLLPTTAQLQSIVTNNDRGCTLQVGAAPLADRAVVRVNPDKLFGRHLAVLGNTGSGKSCTVAGLVRWSIEQATAAREDDVPAPARFIIFDPNGEYGKNFADLKPIIYRVRSDHSTDDQNSDDRQKGCEYRYLSIPAWLWNDDEWVAFTGAKEQAQRPLLLRAIRELRENTVHSSTEEASIRDEIRWPGWLTKTRGFLNQGAAEYASGSSANACGNMVRNLYNEITFYEIKYNNLSDELRKLADVCKKVHPEIGNPTKYINGVSEEHLHEIESILTAIVSKTVTRSAPPRIEHAEYAPFQLDDLPDHLLYVASQEGEKNLSYVQTLRVRLETLLENPRLRETIVETQHAHVSEWIKDFLEIGDKGEGRIRVVDLSLLPPNVVHIVTSVIARIVFETAVRYKRQSGNDRVASTVLVLEEAHTFLHKKTTADPEQVQSAANVCRDTFEKIAREGRKFGVGLVVSSQRPSEISETALSQCNTFILHRIVNDIDQRLISHLVPDSVGGLLRELPNLPSGRAIILGWATSLPILTQLTLLPKEWQPDSKDPEHWNAWTKQRPENHNLSALWPSKQDAASSDLSTMESEYDDPFSIDDSFDAEDFSQEEWGDLFNNGHEPNNWEDDPFE